ncbi:hypothetical protein SAMN05216238_102197 [Lentibacillus persicus]|uniref:Uncharacterized protein n=1 Tax=Lentibacillus persicus TaxID=640948 RepID=A0A1I1TAT6_9BACI|nr:hypothetical protein [Lentibacillus persicus]SFD55731.1 hypothetical protein SAMN05216238_102197 [Lentibacillus persicus]
MRTLVVLLSLIVFFLTGLITGMDRTQQENDRDTYTAEEVSDTETIEEETVVIEQEAPTNNTEEPAGALHLTQKAAGLLESAVTGFFELVVNMAYQLAEVFF